MNDLKQMLRQMVLGQIEFSEAEEEYVLPSHFSVAISIRGIGLGNTSPLTARWSVLVSRAKNLRWLVSAWSTSTVQCYWMSM